MEEEKGREDNPPGRAGWLIWGGIAVTVVGFFVAPWWSWLFGTPAILWASDHQVLWLVPAMSVICSLLAVRKTWAILRVAGVVGCLAVVGAVLWVQSQPMIFATVSWGAYLAAASFLAIAIGAHLSVQQE